MTLKFRVVFYFSIILFGLFFSSFGGISGFFEVLGLYRSGGIPGTGVFSFPITQLVPAAFIFEISNNKRFANIQSIKIPVYLTLVTLVLCQVLIGFRVASVLFLIQFAYIFRNTKMSLYKILTILIMLIIFLAGYSAIRSNIQAEIPDDSETAVYIVKRIGEPLFRSKTTDVFNEIILNKEQDHNFSNVIVEPFLNYLTKFFYIDGFVPDSEMFGREIMYNYFHETRGSDVSVYSGINPGIIGWSFWQLGVWGVTVIAVLLGFVVALISLKGNKSQLSNAVGAIGVSYLVFAIDNPQGAINGFVAQITCLLCYFTYSKIFQKFGNKKVCREIPRQQTL